MAKSKGAKPYNTPDDVADINAELANLDRTFMWQVEIKKISTTRTVLQNRSLHKYLSMLCDALNEGGYTYKVVLNRRAHDAVDEAEKMIGKSNLLPANAKAFVFGWLDHIRSLLNYADTDWTPDLVKNCIWRPIQTAITSKESSTETSTVEIQDVYLQVDRAMSQSFGIHIRWPSLESMSEDQR